MFLTRSLPQNEQLRRFGTPPATLGETLGAAFDDPTLRATELLGREDELQGQTPDDIPDFADDFVIDDDADKVLEEFEPFTSERRAESRQLKSRLVDPETLSEEFSDLGLEFDEPTTREAAEILAQFKREEIIRQDIIARGPQGIGPEVARFGAGLAGAIVDPLNIAASFIPGGQARWAGLLAKQSKLAQRFTVGLVEGAVGNAALEIPTYRLARGQQLDYTMSDALINVIAGGVIGSGGRVIGGAISDRLARLPEPARADVEKAAIAQAVQGKSVDVERLVSQFERDLLSSTTLSRRSPVAAIQDQRINQQAIDARVDAPEPVLSGAGEAVERPPVLAPSTSRSGKLRAFETERGAQRALRDIPDGEVVRSGDGFAIRRPIDADVVRDPEGIVRRFKSRRAADRFVAQTRGDDADGFRSVRTDRGDFVVLEGADDRIVRDIEANPELAVFRDTPRSRVTPTPTRRAAFSPDREQRRLLVEAETAPERDLTADFEASREVEAMRSERRTSVSTDDLAPEAREAAEEAEAIVSGLRGQGLIEDVDDLSVIVTRAEQFGRGAKEAAICLTRNA